MHLQAHFQPSTIHISLLTSIYSLVEIWPEHILLNIFFVSTFAFLAGTIPPFYFHVHFHVPSLHMVWSSLDESYINQGLENLQFMWCSRKINQQDEMNLITVMGS